IHGGAISWLKDDLFVNEPFSSERNQNATKTLQDEITRSAISPASLDARFQVQIRDGIGCCT
ncbi:MAG: hypothetical protein ACRD3W_30600, partial [Terriglobales bacterium]